MSIDYSDPAHRADLIDRVVDDFQRRLAAGEQLTADDLVEAHPELLPELGEQLKFAVLLQQVDRQSDSSGGDSSQGSKLQIRCPHCQRPITVSDDDDLSELDCPSCGSNFRLAGAPGRDVELRPGQTVGQFELVERLGGGAFGTVWSARDQQLERVVAIKIPRWRQLATEEADQFLREARVASQLTHPNIARVYEVGRDGDYFFIVTDLIEGMDLAEWLRDQQPTIHEAAKWCAKLAEALAHAHGLGVVHRDLKPSNILIDAGGQPHLVDFGLAKQQSSDVTMTLDGKLLGTPAYMSPEQARGDARNADARSDVYSLGVILFELLTGERPFRGTIRMLLEQILMDDAPSPRRLNSRVPRDLETICLKCLEKEPQKRYQSAAAVHDELQRFLRGEPITARAITAGERAWRWSQRNPALATIAALLMLVTVVGFVGVTSQWMRTRAARNVASAQRDRAEGNYKTARWQSYRSGIAAASAALELHDMVGARLQLEGCPEEYCGWEWRHFHQRLDNSLGIIGNLPLRIFPQLPVGVGFSDDGSHVFCANGEETKMWNVETWRAIEEIPLQSLLNHDGTRIATWSNGKVRVFQVPQTEEVSVIDPSYAEIQPLCFSRDGARLALAAADRNQASIWDATTGERIADIELPAERTNRRETEFSPNNQYLAMRTAGGEPSMLLWEVATGELVRSWNTTESGRVTSIDFSSDDSALASSATYPVSSVYLWDCSNGSKLTELSGHSNSIRSVRFDRATGRLASCSHDKTLRIWDTGTHQQILSLTGFADAPNFLAFSPDGTTLAVSSAAQTISLFDAQSGRRLGALTGEERSVERLGFSPDSTLMVARARGGAIRMWDLRANAALTGHEDYVYDACFTPGGEHVVSAGWDNSVRIWQVSERQLVKTLATDSAALVVAVSPSGDYIAALTRTNSLYLWSRNDGELIHHWPDDRTTTSFEGYGLAFSPDSRLLAISGMRGIQVRQIETGDSVLNMTPPTVGSPIVFSHDGACLIANGLHIRVEDGAAVEPVFAWRGRGTSLVLNRRGNILAAADRSGSVRLWDASDGRELAVLQHTTPVYDLAFSRDDIRVATACSDNTIRIWDVATGDEVGVLRGHSDYVHGVDFSPDGTRLVSASGDTTLRIWDTIPVHVRQRSPGTYVPPNNYVCHRAPATVKIDGRLDEPAWESAPWTDSFVDIEGDAKLPPRFDTRAKMMWDDEYFYVAAELEEPHVWGTVIEPDTKIYVDNDFEVFIDPDGDRHRYAEFEMNTLGTVWDLLLTKPYHAGGKALTEWDIPGLKSAVHIDGTLNDSSDTDRGWTVELAIPWQAMEELTEQPCPPRDEDQWRVNFSRVEWQHRLVNDNYLKVPGLREDNWVWSPQGVVNMHRPETWGYVQFSSSPIGVARFRPDGAARARHELVRICNAQRKFRAVHSHWASALDELELPGGLPDDLFLHFPTIEVTESGYVVVGRIKATDGSVHDWHIQQDGRVWSDRNRD